MVVMLFSVTESTDTSQIFPPPLFTTTSDDGVHKNVETVLTRSESTVAVIISVDFIVNTATVAKAAGASAAVVVVDVSGC
jgi:hypothetical protein